MKEVIIKLKSHWESYPEVKSLRFDRVVDDVMNCYSFDFELDDGFKTYWFDFNIENFDVEVLLSEVEKEFFQTEQFQDYCFDHKVKGDRIRDFILGFYGRISELHSDDVAELMIKITKEVTISKKNIIKLL